MPAVKNPAEEHYQNALITEVVPLDTVTMEPVKKEPVRLNLKKLVQIQVNDYKVGLLGGIKNLRLVVFNKSGYVLDNVKMEVCFLKPNGDVIKKEQVTIKSVFPKSSKSRAVSAQKRGVKVSCRIIEILSSQQAGHMVNL